MRLHKLTIENLNSLRGTWELDFDRDLAQAPLFLVRGPTGAGKSTLLDAISLALFGETPRLPRRVLSAKDLLGRDDPRRCMSHGTGYCRAELVFSVTQHGKRARFLAGWSAERARKKPDGRFQRPRQSLQRWDEQRRQWSKPSSDYGPKTHDAVVRELLDGMSRVEFQRRILLAQGEFAAFLREDDEQRAQLLAKLTDDMRFEQVGRIAHERFQEAGEQLRAAEQRLQGLGDALLDDDARAELTAAIAAGEQQLTTATAQRQAAEAAAAWSNRLVELQQQVGAALRAEEQAERDRAAHDPQLKQLQDHLDAAEAAGARAIQERAAASHDQLAGQLQVQQDALPALQQALTAAQGAAATRRTEADLAHRALQEQLPAIQAAKQAQVEASKAATTAQQATEEVAVRAGALAKAVEALAAAKQRESDTGQAATTATESVERERDGEALVGQVEALRESAKRHRSIGKELHDLQQERTASQATLRRLEKVAHDAERAAQQAAERAELQRARLSESASELTKAAADGAAAAGTDALVHERSTVAAARLAVAEQRRLLQEELARLQDQRSLASKRAGLRPGEPCPVCGSEEHPNADVRAARAHDERLQAQVDALAGRREALADARDGLDRAEKRATDAINAAALAREQAAHVRSRATDANDRVAQLDARWASCEQERAQLVEQLQLRLPTRLRPETPAGLPAAVEAVIALVERWKAAEAAQREAQRAWSDAKAGVALAEQARQAAAREHEEQVGRARALRDVAVDARDAATAATRDGEPDARLAALNRAITDTSRRATTAQDHATATLAALTAAQGQVEALREQLARLGEAVSTAQVNAAAALAALGWTEEQLRLRRLPEEQARERIALRDRLILALRDATALHGQAVAQLAEHQQRPPVGTVAPTGPEDSETAAVTTQQAAVLAREQEQQAREQLAAARTRLQGDDEQRQRAKMRALAVQKATRKHREAARLNHLIGARQGRRFRDFAMSLALQRLTFAANVHLARFSDRYRLDVARDEHEFPTLHFAVLDAYAANRRREVTTLSGGETFLVSLALALGLAGMGRSKLRIETLLLDEGFSSLDPQTLDAALGALKRLNEQAVQVGVISHVQGLEEHVPVQVHITPQGNGRSTLSVTGV